MKIQTMLIGAVALSMIQLGGAAAKAQNAPKFGARVDVEGRVLPAHGELSVAFSGPVSLPGLSLAPGRYIFRQPGQNVVQLADANGTPYKMFLTLPTVRQHAEDGVSIVLGPRTKPDSPQRIMAMFAPGETTGQAFIYPGR
jgi:hypothetical protein